MPGKLEILASSALVWASLLANDDELDDELAEGFVMLEFLVPLNVLEVDAVEIVLLVVPLLTSLDLVCGRRFAVAALFKALIRVFALGTTLVTKILRADGAESFANIFIDL